MKFRQQALKISAFFIMGSLLGGCGDSDSFVFVPQGTTQGTTSTIVTGWNSPVLPATRTLQVSFDVQSLPLDTQLIDVLKFELRSESGTLQSRNIIPGQQISFAEVGPERQLLRVLVCDAAQNVIGYFDRLLPRGSADLSETIPGLRYETPPQDPSFDELEEGEPYFLLQIFPQGLDGGQKIHLTAQAFSAAGYPRAGVVSDVQVQSAVNNFTPEILNSNADGSLVSLGSSFDRVNDVVQARLQLRAVGFQTTQSLAIDIFPPFFRSLTNLTTMGNGMSWNPDISGDGSLISFESEATNLSPEDNNPGSDIYLLTINPLIFDLISRTPQNRQGNRKSERSRISADGRFVVFESDASDLVANDNNGFRDVFLFNREQDTVERVSFTSNGQEPNGPSFHAQISRDGRFISFQSNATNMTSDEDNNQGDIFVLDRQTQALIRIPMNDNEAGNGTSDDGGLGVIGGKHAQSRDANFIAFASDDPGLLPNGNDGFGQVYVYERATGNIELVSVNNQRERGNATSKEPSLSADGRFVAFESFANNLVPNDRNFQNDIFVRDRLLGTTERVSVNSNGEEADFVGDSVAPNISEDGRFVVFSSQATNLVPDDRGFPDVFIFDRLSRRIERLSVTSTGAQANHYSSSPSISLDGRFITFETFASNIIPGDRNGFTDIVRVPNPYLR